MGSEPTVEGEQSADVGQVLDPATQKNVDAARTAMSDPRGATGRKATRGGRGGRRTSASAARARDERTRRR